MRSSTIKDKGHKSSQSEVPAISNPLHLHQENVYTKVEAPSEPPPPVKRHDYEGRSKKRSYEA